MDVATLTALVDFPRLLEAHYTVIPAGFENWKPASWDGVPSEPYSPIEQICHVRDIEIDGYHVRFARTLAETCPVLPGVDGDTLALTREYAHADAAEVFAAFRTARQKTLSLIENLTPDQFDRTAEFDGYGLVTLRGLVHFLCSHDQQHLAGLQWLAGKIDGARRAASKR